MSYANEKMYNKYLSKYKNPEATRREIVEVTQQYRGLEVKQETFTFRDGSRMDLVNLQGTIPIHYRGTSYNIPICIWLMDTHPNNAPMCYLKPTPNMKIKISMHVDHNGKIYMPYLHDWSPATSDVLSLIQVLIMHFNDEPPLYQVRNDQAPQPPSVTPYPTQSNFMPMPGVTNSSPFPSYPVSQPTPYPLQPMQPPAISLDYQHQYPGYPSYPKGPTTSYPSYPPYPTSSAIGPSDASTGTITEQHIHASLLSAVEDKVRRRLREQLAQTQAELVTLERIQLELTQGKSRLDHLISKLEQEQVEWEKTVEALQSKEAELETALSRLSDQGAVDVDEAVTTTAPLYKQLLNAFAEEAATEDVIYYLGEALRRGVIDLDIFLKHVRSLSHKQFMLRALMQKCRAKAGLAG